MFTIVNINNQPRDSGSPQEISGLITNVREKGLVIGSKDRLIFIPYSMIQSVQYTDGYFLLYLEGFAVENAQGEIYFEPLSALKPGGYWDKSFQSSLGHSWKRTTYVQPVLKEKPTIPLFDQLVFYRKRPERLLVSAIQKKLHQARHSKVIVYL